MGYGKRTWSTSILGDEDRDLFDDRPGNDALGGYSTLGGTGYTGTGSTTFKPRCHETHKELEIGGGILLGASCSSPRKGFDVYVGFDWSMSFQHQQKPWSKTPHTDPVEEGLFKITDGSTPVDFDEFDLMVEYVCAKLKDGKRVHLGCIGGHGRTGLVMAVIVKKLMPEVKDPVLWVREHHCKKAVETAGQMKWLRDHYGIESTVKGSKSGSWESSSFDDRYPAHGKRKGKGAKVTDLHGGDRDTPFALEAPGKTRTDVQAGATYTPIRRKTSVFSGS